MSNPGDVLKVLEFQTNQNKTKNVNKISRQVDAAQLAAAGIGPGPMPQEKDLKLSDLVSKDDPNLLYKDMQQIGEGAAGVVFVTTNQKTGQKVAVKKMSLNAERYECARSKCVHSVIMVHAGENSLRVHYCLPLFSHNCIFTCL